MLISYRMRSKMDVSYNKLFKLLIDKVVDESVKNEILSWVNP